MLFTVAKAVLGILALSLVWVAVDLAWRRTFSDQKNSRPSCGGCLSCTHRCAKND